MAFTAAEESLNTPSSKTHILTQIFLRISAIVTTLTAAALMLSSKEHTVVFGIPVDARYSYSPPFKFFAFENIVVFALSVVSLVVVLIMGRKKTIDPKYYFFLFLYDLAITVLLMGGFAAAVAVGYVGKYGNSHSGWMPICDHFSKFCNRSTISLVLGFLGFAVYLILTVISAMKSSQVQA